MKKYILKTNLLGYKEGQEITEQETLCLKSDYQECIDEPQPEDLFLKLMEGLKFSKYDNENNFYKNSFFYRNSNGENVIQIFFEHSYATFNYSLFWSKFKDHWDMPYGDLQNLLKEMLFKHLNCKVDMVWDFSSEEDVDKYESKNSSK